MPFGFDGFFGCCFLGGGRASESEVEEMSLGESDEDEVDSRFRGVLILRFDFSWLELEDRLRRFRCLDAAEDAPLALESDDTPSADPSDAELSSCLSAFDCCELMLWGFLNCLTTAGLGVGLGSNPAGKLRGLRPSGCCTTGFVIASRDVLPAWSASTISCRARRLSKRFDEGLYFPPLDGTSKVVSLAVVGCARKIYLAPLCEMGSLLCIWFFVSFLILERGTEAGQVMWNSCFPLRSGRGVSGLVELMREKPAGGMYTSSVGA